jgi:hypothetical protein
LPNCGSFALHYFSPFVLFLSFVSFHLNVQNSIRVRFARVYSENDIVEIRLGPSMDLILEQTTHRPWPLPSGSWGVAARTANLNRPL